MMADTARMIANDHGWASLAVAGMLAYGLISLWLTYRYILGGNLLQFRPRLKAHATRCLDKTGYVGAMLARHTVLITANVLVLSLSFNLLSTLRGMDEISGTVAMLENGLHLLAGACIVLVALTVAITFMLCNEIVRQGEAES